jgi:hypothetical protein
MARIFSSNYIVNGFPWWGTRPDTLMLNEAEGDVNHPVWFVKLAFDAADVNFHSGLGDITWGGDVCTGTGAIGSISGIEENADLSRTPITLGLTGLPNTLLAAFLDEHYQGRMATVYIGYRDMTTHQLVSDPIILYRGLMDVPRVKRGEKFDITLTVESRFAQWDRPQVRRYTDADQKSRYPEDTCFEGSEQDADKQVIWGGKAP